jgi:hypothetical protein
MRQLETKMVKFKNPVSNPATTKAYKKELSNLSANEYMQIAALNKKENAASKAGYQISKNKHAQLKIQKKQILETQRSLKSASRDAKRFGNSATSSFKKAANAAKSANLTFSRYFTRFALVGAGSFFLTLRKTLKDVKEFQASGGRGTDSIFNSKQLQAVNQFNLSLKQTKRTLGSLRDGFIINLLPAFKEHLDTLNEWLFKNRELVKTKLKGFVEGLGKVFSNLSTAISGVFSVFNPLVNLIGGWGNVLTGFIGLGILSWVMRLGVFLKNGAAAIFFFTGAVRTLTVALMTNPICLTLMAIAAAVALIADEFIVTARGGDSLMNRFSGLKQVVNNFVDVIKKAWEWLVKLNQAVFDFSFGGGAKDMFDGMVDGAKETASEISNIFSKAFGGKHVAKGQINIGQQGIKNHKPNELLNGLNVRYAQQPRHFLNTNNSNKTTKNIITNHINITAPTGGTETENRNMVGLIKDEIKSELDLQHVKLMAAIG